MCSIFHNRINYRGPRNNGTTDSGNGTLTKELDADRNNNGCTGAMVVEELTEDERVASLRDEEAETMRTHHKPHTSEDGVATEANIDEDFEDSNEALDLSVISGRLPPSGHVALEALQHTKVAVAQFAATAIANSQNYNDAVSDLAMVQSTIFNVQRQHLMQLQLIQHLQSQLKRTNTGNEVIDRDEEKGCDKATPKELLQLRESEENSEDPQVAAVVTKASLEKDNAISKDIAVAKVAENGNVREVKEPVKTVVTEEKTKTENISAIRVNPDLGNVGVKDDKNGSCGINSYQPLLGDISSTLASSIITNHDPPPALNEPNCLEMLQRRTEEVLDSASQSLHATQLQDEYDNMQRDAQGRGEIFKHRCKYCGKIFGSYSALQIHLRSHTGERPFHCNVCGSKFTTKGNLKVHYQRHTQIFPPMLLAPNAGPPCPEQYGPFVPMRSITPPHLPIRLPYLDPSSQVVEEPKDDKPSSALIPNINESSEERIQENQISRHSPIADNPQDLSKPSVKENEMIESNPELDSAKTLKQTKGPLENNKEPTIEKSEKTPNPQTSKRSSSTKKRNSSAGTGTPPTVNHRKSNASAEELEHHHHQSKALRRSSVSRNSHHNGLEHYSNDFSLAHMERIIDKSWEDLIEIDKTSETSKLQQLVDNIENKLTDPNQCIFCQKVMSCRSSLQMHLRTHTGERPFRCKICGRAFATKGNLKAHMSIHKIKPPMRSQFKCPVCHQKFSNGIILQQHIRIHTIDDGSGVGIGLPGLPNVNGVNVNNVDALAEHNARVKAHMDVSIEDQNSNKSIGASDNFDFSTMSEYSGQRSESSQGDFDDFMTMDSTDDSRENSSSLTPLDRQISEDYDERSETERIREGVDLSNAIDLSARGYGINGMSSKTLEHLPMLGVPPNFLLMAAAREEMQALGAHHKFPLLPFGPLGFMGLHPAHAPICNLCFKIFASATALENHIQNEHAKEADGTPRSNCDTSPFNAKLTLNPNLFRKKADNTAIDGNAKRHSPNSTCNESAENFQPTSEAHENNVTGADPSTLSKRIKQEPNTEVELKQVCNSLEDNSGPVSPNQLESSPNPIHDADAEQSLMKMQLLSSFPLDAHVHSTMPNPDAHRFPASPLDFQQALMSVGPPSSTLESSINNKHFCHVCRRNFSSSSALQIHMRTHTGDKPFQCNVCQKAFTTKGNLKVHMGTHMWSNPTSRRGRRMSLELPLHRPGSLPGEAEFIQRRPELFFPYLPPFFNGLPSKLGDVGPPNFIPPPHFPNGATSKYPPGLLGFPPFLGPPHNFSAMTQIERHNNNKSPASSTDETIKPVDSPRSDATTWNNTFDKIKTENNQNESNQLDGNADEKNMEK